jgi:drug/metabolite transporter (DMT)-like permease
MKPILFAMAACFCFAIINVIVARNFTKVTPTLNATLFPAIACITGMMFVIMQSQCGAKISVPPQNLWWLIVIGGIAVFCGQALFYCAYHYGGSVATLTIITGTLFPVFASFLLWIFGGGLPKWNECVAFGLALVAILFLTLFAKT